MEDRNERCDGSWFLDPLTDEMNVPAMITCVDCGQPAHLLSHPPEDGWEYGDIVAYRCSGCNDRWDLVFEETDSAGDDNVNEARRILEQRQRGG